MQFSAFLAAAFAFGGPATFLVDDDGGPGVAFTDLPAAVAAAADGDVVLVRPGFYSGFANAGKAIRFLATDLSDPPQVGATLFTGPALAEAYVQGFVFAGGPALSAAVVAPGGRAVFADCSFFGGVGAAGLFVDGGAAALARCTLVGGPSAVAAGDGAACVGGGTLACDATVAAGGFGLSTAFGAGAGGHGVRVVGGAVSATRSSCFGGGVPVAAGVAAAAGDGVRLGPGSARLSGESFDVVAGGGAYGVVAAGVATTPGAGVATLAGGGAIVHGPLLILGGEGVVAGAGPLFVGPPPVAETALPRLEVLGDVTATGTMTVQLELGPPGGVFAVLLAFGSSFAVPLPIPLVGDVHLDATAVAGVIGLLDATGLAAFTGAFGLLDPSFVGTPLHLQAGAFDGLRWRISNPVIHYLR